MVLDDNLNIVHRKILDITFFNDTNNIIFNNITYLSNLYISGSAIINTNGNINSSLYITNSALLNNVTANSVTVVNQFNSNSLSTSNITINSALLNNNLYNALDTIMYKSGTIVSTLSAYNTKADTIITNNITSNNIIISSKIINIGTTNSKINIYAKSIGVSTTEAVINDNILELNINVTTLTAFDIGNQSGFEILGTDNNNGFIKTNVLANLFEIKCPQNPVTEYILNVNDVNNLTILGATNMLKNLTINSSLYISNKSFLNNISITSILYSKDNINTYNASTSCSMVYISNKLICSDIIKILNSNLIVNKDCIFSNNTSILSNINVLNTCVINSNNIINSAVYVNNDIVSNNNMYINNNLNVLNNTFINNNLTVLSFLNLRNNGIIINNLTINSNLNLGNIKTNNSVTINSNLNILGNGVLNSTNTLGSVFNTVTLLGNITLSDKILDFNSSDIANINEIPMGKLYRTGGILKIKIAKLVPPVMALIGLSIVPILRGNNYIESGVSSISSNGDILKSYIISIGTNILTIPIEAIINSTVVLGVTTGVCNIVYKSFDTDNNVQYITRILNISNNIIPPTMQLIGDNIIYLSIASKYTDFGVISTSYYNDILKSYIVSIGNNILTSPIEAGTIIPLISTLVIGTYNIVYKSTDSDGNIQNITRILNITSLDTIPPVITVNGVNPLSVHKGSNIIDPGVTSIDDSDGKVDVYLIAILSGTIILSVSTVLTGITNLLSNNILITSSTTIINVVLNTGNYTLVYKSTDSANNISTSTRYLTILDNIPPVITVNGANPLRVYKGSNIIDPGITSIDNIDGNLDVYLIAILSGTIILSVSTVLTGITNLLSNNIPITSSTTIINVVLNSGDYTLVYKSTDSVNNISTSTRYLTILDIIPPVITVNGANPLGFYNGYDIIDPGVTSIDNIDGNLDVYLIAILSGTIILSVSTVLTGITNLLSNNIPITSSTTIINVVLNIGNYTLVYRSTDSANNISTSTRYLTILDTAIGPTISLIDASVLTVDKNTIYNEPGISIANNIDNLIPYISSIKSNDIELLISNIPVSNSLNIPQIDTSIEKTCIFTYSVTDRFNNISTIIRTVNIKYILAKLVLFNDTSIGRTFKNSTDFGSLPITPSITFTSDTIVQVGGSSMWGFKGSSMPQVDFSYNGKWSVMIKMKHTKGRDTVAELQFDNKLTGWGLPGRCSHIPDRAGDSFVPIRGDSSTGGSSNSAMPPTFFNSLINAEFYNTGVYFVISRLNNYMEFKAYNLQGVLRWSKKSVSVFTYTYMQTLFTIWLYPPYDIYTFYKGVLTSTIVELTPAHWNEYVV